MDRKARLYVHFKCCNVYQHIGLNQKGDAFVGWCPRCARKVVIRVAPDAKPGKFFEAE